jgi:hypothetical protein
MRRIAVIGLPLVLVLACLVLVAASAAATNVIPKTAPAGAGNINDGKMYFTRPWVDILQHELYLSYSDASEFTVAAAGKELKLEEGDYVSHADTVRMLSGGLSEYLSSGETEEVVVPVVDTDASSNGGNKVLGFVVVKPFAPRKLFFRRGEVAWDPTDGGLVPQLSGNAADLTGQPYTDPHHGGGSCISGRDCFNYNGTCVKGVCSCGKMYTGTYCQVSTVCCVIDWSLLPSRILSLQIYQADLSEVKRKFRDSTRNAFIGSPPAVSPQQAQQAPPVDESAKHSVKLKRKPAASEATEVPVAAVTPEPQPPIDQSPPPMEPEDKEVEQQDSPDAGASKPKPKKKKKPP